MVCLYFLIIFKQLSVHKNNNGSFSKMINGKRFERLKENFAVNNSESKNTQNELTVVPTKGNLLFFYYIKPF